MAKGDSKVKLAKAGDELTAKAGAKLRKLGPHMTRIFSTREACVVQPKSDAAQGSWLCISCGEVFQNNMGAHSHVPSHKLAWWTGEQIEEA